MKEQLDISLKNLVGKLGMWLDAIILNLPNVLLALLIFVTAYYFAQKLNAFFVKILRNKIKQVSIRALLGNVISFIVIAIGLFLSLSILNLDKALTSILAGAGVAGLAIGLALQGALANTFSGIFLAIKKVINVGDFIETNGFSGTVDEINLRHIKLRETDNNIVIIPNSMVLENPFKNFGLTRKIRVTLECGVGYESDLRSVKKIAEETIANAFPQEKNQIEFHYLEFGGSSVNFQMRFWVDAVQSLTLLEAKSEAIMLLKEKFDARNINIPYPIRTLISKSA